MTETLDTLEQSKAPLVNEITKTLDPTYLVYIDRKWINTEGIRKQRLYSLFNPYEIYLAQKLGLHTDQQNIDANVYGYKNKKITTLHITTSNTTNEIISNISANAATITMTKKAALKSLNSGKLIGKGTPTIEIRIPEIKLNSEINIHKNYFAPKKDTGLTRSILIDNLTTLKTTISNRAIKHENESEKKQQLISQTKDNIQTIINTIKDGSLTDLELYAIIRLIMSQVHKKSK